MSAPCESVVANPDDAPIDVEVEDADLHEVVAGIAARTGARVVVDPEVRARVTIALRRMPVREALEVIARAARCELDERPDGWVIHGPLCSLTIAVAPVTRLGPILRLIAVTLGKRLDIEPDLALEPCPFSGTLRGDHWSFLLELVRRAHLEVAVDGDTIHVTRPPI